MIHREVFKGAIDMEVTTRATKRHKKHGFRGFIIIAAILCLAIFLITYIGKIPKEMISLFLSNPEAHSFVIDYPSHINDTDIGEISPSELSGGIPRFQQWDERWGYYPYGSSVLGLTGCGPTCLSMVIVGLTENIDVTPATVANFSEQSGCYVDGVGTSWDLMTSGAANYGLSCEQVGLSEDEMVSELSSGHPLIASMGPGDFTSSGHFIVITGYANGMFEVNDPNSKKRSNEGWYYSTLAPQIRCLWTYALA